MEVYCQTCGKSMETQVSPDTLKYCLFRCDDCFSAKKEVWKAGKETYPATEFSANREQESIFIESDDFEHDVRLYVDGYFLNDEQKYEYAKQLAKRLNKCTAQQI